MKHFKKLIPVFMLIALMIPCTVMAAKSSVTIQKLKKTNTTVTCKELTYNGEKRSIKGLKVVYTTSTGKKITLTKGTDYTVNYTKHVKAGTYKIKITGKGKYTGTVNATYTIKKASQSKLKVTNKYTTKKASSFKKKSRSYTFKVSGVKENAKVTVKTSSKKITYSAKKGKITLKKGIKKGTYKITVKLAATKNYAKKTKTITIKVK